jgi:serine/threonine-protein kinase
MLDSAQETVFSLVRCPRCRSEIRVRRMIGPYELLEVAGRGGSGRVFRARCDAESEGFGDIALKLLERSVPDYEEHLMMLRNEAVCARLVDHPSVVKVLALEEDQMGARLVMEFMHGGSLHDRIVSSESESKRLDEKSVLRIGVEILDALGRAESHGIVHCDLKPANILFTHNGEAKLGDFGLARSIAAKPIAQTHLLATPDYVAPEMLEGFSGDRRSDLYGLGCCLYHALTSSPPYQTEGLSIPELLDLKSKPIPLGSMKASPATRDLIARMTDPNPSKRFASHDQVLNGMLAALESTGSVEKKEARLGGLMRNLLAGKIRKR